MQLMMEHVIQYDDDNCTKCPPCECWFYSWHSCTFESKKILPANPTDMDVNISHPLRLPEPQPQMTKASPQKRRLLNPYMTSSSLPFPSLLSNGPAATINSAQHQHQPSTAPHQPHSSIPQA
jgi:hypothetical protein